MTSDLDTIEAVEWMLEGAGHVGRTLTRLPRPSAGEVRVSTALGAISPGRERTLLHGTSPFVGEGRYPYQPGYLNVVQILDAADRTLLGERGIAVLGHRDFALVPYARFVRIPAGVSDEMALMGVLAADAHHAMEVAAVESSEECLVLGGGILGVLTAWELALRTEGTVRLVERDPKRRKLLGEIRFPREVELEDGFLGASYHTVFDCASSSEAFEGAQAGARDGGSIVLIADGNHEKYSLTGDFFAKGLYLGKTESNPDLRAFLGEWFARHEDRSTLTDVVFRDEIRFADFPQAYLEAVLAPPDEQRGLVPLVRFD